MFDILNEYLKLAQAPEMIDLYDRAFALFDEYDLQDYELGYSDALMTQSYEDIFPLTMSNLQVIAREHQLPIKPDAPMIAYIQALEFVKQIEKTELLQQVSDICTNEDMDAQEKWFALLDVVINVPAEETMEYVSETVPEILIARIYEYASRREAQERQISQLPEGYAQMCREMALYSRQIGGNEMVSYKHLMEDNGIVGMPFEYYWSANRDYLMALPALAMVYECIGFVLFCEEGTADVQGTILKSISRSITNIDVMVKIQNLLVETLMQYKKAISSGMSAAEVIQ